MDEDLFRGRVPSVFADARSARHCPDHLSFSHHMILDATYDQGVPYLFFACSSSSSQF